MKILRGDWSELKGRVILSATIDKITGLHMYSTTFIGDLDNYQIKVDSEEGYHYWLLPYSALNNNIDSKLVDHLHAGQFNEVGFLKPALYGLAEFYMMHYFDQRKKSVEQQITKENFSQYVYSIIAEMQRTKNKSKYEFLRLEIIKKIPDNVLLNAVTNLSLELRMECWDKERIRTHIELIDAIAKERFGLAELLSKRLNKKEDL